VRHDRREGGKGRGRGSQKFLLEEKIACGRGRGRSSFFNDKMNYKHERGGPEDAPREKRGGRLYPSLKEHRPVQKAVIKKKRGLQNFS